MKFTSVSIGLLGAVAFADAYLVPPPGPVLPTTIADCSGWVLPVAADTCATIAPKHGITVAQFIKYNPLVGAACTLTPGFAYCIQENFGNASPTTTSTTTSTTHRSTSVKTTSTKTPPATTTTPVGNGIATPTPIQAGMATDCKAFYFVVAGDQCGLIASAKGITLANFYAWNPAVGNTCMSLWAQYYVCVAVIGGSTVTPTATTSPGNGIATPTPIQPGLIGSCKKFHLVASGDQCGLIATAAGITLDSFYKWNPGVGNTCATLWLGYYVCIGI